jgi:hypothetical protein
MFYIQMKKTTPLIMLFILSNLSLAQPVANVYKMPPSLVTQLKAETEQRQRGECEKKPEFSIKNFYSLNHKLLLFIGLPDYFCNASSFMPVTVDAQGHWEAGAVIESYPSFLLTHKTQQLWLVSHWEIEGVFPLLHFSTDAIHWQEISLPKPEKIECCFHYLKQVCVNESSIQLKMTGIEDAPIEYWQTSINDSLTTTPHWKKLTTEQIKNDQQCKAEPMISGDWQQQLARNGNEIWIQSATSSIKVIIPRWLK